MGAKFIPGILAQAVPGAVRNPSLNHASLFYVLHAPMFHVLVHRIIRISREHSSFWNLPPSRLATPDGSCRQPIRPRALTSCTLCALAREARQGHLNPHSAPSCSPRLQVTRVPLVVSAKKTSDDSRAARGRLSHLPLPLRHPPRRTSATLFSAATSSASPTSTSFRRLPRCACQTVAVTSRAVSP